MKKIIAAAVSAVISLSSVASSMPLIKETSMTVSAEGAGLSRLLGLVNLSNT